MVNSQSPPPTHHAVADAPEPVSLSSGAMMLAGLLGGYGLFAWIGSRFLLPARSGELTQLFVTRVDDLQVDGTLLYRTPGGATVNITRREATGAATDFIALSSTCPHLGCQVRWESQNNRYFCPCHNGTFDPSGKATGGPPGDAGQSLPRYPLTVQKGLLYIGVPTEQLSVGQTAGIVQPTTPAGPGHDPCLGCLQPRPGTRTEGRAARTEGRDARAEGRDTRTEGRDTRAEGRDTRTEGRDTSTEGRDTRTEGRDFSPGHTT